MNSKWNRCYRLIWSESSREWVVADELTSAGSKSKSRGALSRILCAALLMGGLLAAEPEDALADTCPTANTTISTAVVGQCIVTGTDQVTITNAGSLKDTATFPGTLSVDAGATGVTIDNSGKILWNSSRPNIIVDTAARGTTIINQAGASLTNFRGANIQFGLGSFDLGTTLTNHGTIKVSGTATSSATGVLVVGDLAGTLINTNSISALAQTSSSSSTARAWGIRVSGDISGTLSNSGTISATAIQINTNTSSASATGIDAGSLSGALTNSGTISASASVISSNTNATAYGVNIGTLAAGGNLTNSGTISASANNNSSNARAYGVYILTSLDGTISNSGTIQATATAGNIFESAHGIWISSMAGTGVLNNSGMISATVSQPAKIASAYSLKVFTSTGGTINNLAGGTLRGNIDVAGAAVVNNAGTIEIPDAIATASIATALNNQAGGVLQIGGGSTLTTPDIQNAGTVSVLDGASATISGNLTQLAGGKIKVGASSGRSFGQLNVTGTADLTASGAFDVNVAGANTLAVGNVLTGVLTAGVLNAGAITVSDNSLLFDFTGAVDGVGTGVDLTTIAAGGGGGGAGGNTVLGSVLATGFTAGTGAAVVYDNLIGGAPASADMANVITALGTLATQQQVSDAVAQSVPLMTGGMSLAMLDVTRGISHILELRLSGMQGMASGDGYFSDGNVWIKPFGSLAHQEDRNGAFGFDANSYGLAVGFDNDMSERSKLALGFIWGHTVLDSAATTTPQSADIDSFQLAASGSYNIDADTVFTISANGGINKNSGDRIINFGGLNRLASSDYTSWSGHAGANIGHHFVLDNKTVITPSLRADYAVIREDSYSETGAGALNLNVGSTTTDELLLGADGALEYAMTDEAMLTATLGAAYDVLGEQTSITSSFAGAPTATFTTLGIDPSRWLGRSSVGIVFKVTDQIDITTAYDAELRRDFANQTGSIKLNWVF